MSSGSPSQIVYDVGGRATRDAEQSPDRLPAELPAQVVQRTIERSLGSRLAGDTRQAVPPISSSANGSSPSSSGEASRHAMAEAMLSP